MFLKEPEYQRTDHKTKDSLEYSIADGMSYNIFFTLTTGVFLIAFALYLGATPFQIGILSSLPFLANVFQIIGAYFVESGWERKLISVSTSLIGRLLWIPIILIPFFLPNQSSAIWILIILYGVSNVFGSLSAVAWLSWMSNIVPKEILGRFFSKRNMYVGITGMIVGILGGFFLDYWGLTHTPLEGFVILFSTSILFGVISVVFLGMMHNTISGWEKVNFKKFIELSKKPYNDQNFTKLLKFGIIWSLGLGLAGPFFIVYQIDVLELGYSWIMILNTLFIVTGLISLHAWGNVVDKYGSKPVLAITSFIVSIYPLFYLFITNSNYWLLIPINIFVGIAWAGVDFSLGQLLLRVSPQSNRSIFFSSFTALTGLAFALAAILGGVIATMAMNFSYTIYAITFYGLHFLFFIAFLLRIWSSSFIEGIREQSSGRLEDVITDLKQQRMMNVFVNFYHISQFSLGVVTLPWIYSTRIFKEGQKTFDRQIFRAKFNSIKKLKDLELAIKLFSDKIGRNKELQILIPNLNLIRRDVAKLGIKVEKSPDENVLETMKDGLDNLDRKVFQLENKINTFDKVKSLPMVGVQKIIKTIRDLNRKFVR